MKYSNATESDHLEDMFATACIQCGGETRNTEVPKHCAISLARSSSRALCITTEYGWRKFMDSLVKEGFIARREGQCNLQKLWDRILAGTASFGDRKAPSLTFREIKACVDDIYSDELSAGVTRKIRSTHEGVKELVSLLESYKAHKFSHAQTQQALNTLRWLEDVQRSALGYVEQEQRRQCNILVTESIARMTCETSWEKSDVRDEDNHSSVADSAAGEGVPYTDTNARLWQASNVGLVEKKFAEARCRAICYTPTVNHRVSKMDTSHPRNGGTQNDSWGLSQGLAGSQGICCRRGLANRGTGEEYPVTVVITPKVGSTYSSREKLWRAFLAHRQLAAASCVMHVLGFCDRDPAETSFWFQYMKARSASALLDGRSLDESGPLFRHWSRCILMCVAQLSEQSTYTLERQLTLENVMIEYQGTIVRLGGLRWGSEVQGADAAARTAFVQRDTELSAWVANILEDLLGLSDGNQRDDTAESSGIGLPRSPVLANILAWLRLPMRSRNGMPLKMLQRHPYFTPLSASDLETVFPEAWKTFVGVV